MADDDMANGNDVARQYLDAAHAQLGERVTNLGRRQTDLESEMRSGFKQIENSFASFSNETRNSIAALSSTLAERNKPQWQALSVMLAAVVAIGGLAYMPIREATNDLKTSVGSLSEKIVTRQEMDWRAQRGVEDRTRTDAAVSDLRLSAVTRNEWSERNRARDQEVLDLNRRVDELRQDVGSVYGTRDVIIDLKKDVETLRQRIAANRSDG
ncbi:hypothetical protein [Mesorhizobium sp. BE184]|uniref:hypothetical protein n=1 Tax=Mesorhizobium sp. BE184 TaxID=2817714 RepID=UPI00285FE6F0|nr:hypothetical protein [Mesorhizobium sp. BE184]MDR7032444.1 hypothetical protein [Mesorhizobium sp. BE184]